ncbi:MAG TPA: glycosyltransferase family 9 protein, partial [Candidatus Kapabacteria bacterium]|nr:glycosyltransferase family 9 protein [Candidatus Kapabacteria bacterium]
PYVVLLHGAAWESKLWTEDRWITLAQRARKAGLEIYLPWGSEGERARAERIAGAVNGIALGKLSIKDLVATIANAKFVVGLDTGLTHIAVALAVPTLTLYGPSVPVYDRLARGELINLCSTNSKIVDTSRLNTVPTEAAIAAVQPWIERSAL